MTTDRLKALRRCTDREGVCVHCHRPAPFRLSWPFVVVFVASMAFAFGVLFVVMGGLKR